MTNSVLNNVQQNTDLLAAKIRNTFDRTLTNYRKNQDFPSGFIITEILQDRSEGRQIKLFGNQMPQIPFEGVGGDQRIVKTYYAGNDVPTIQVLGAEEPDFTIRGILTDKKLQDSSFYGFSYQLATTIDDFRYQGNLLRLELGEWKRYGFIKSCRFPMKTLGMLEYQITFGLIGFFLPENLNILEQQKISPYQNNIDTINYVQGIREQLAEKPPTVSLSIYDQVSLLFSEYIAEPISTLTNFVESIIETGKDIQNSIDRVYGFILYARKQVSRYNRLMGNIPYNNSSQSVAQNLTNAKFVSDYRAESRPISSLLANYQSLIEQLRDQIPLNRHVIQNGDTLQNLAIRYYNDATLWNNIYDHNNLTSSSLVIGDIIEIPRL